VLNDTLIRPLWP